MNQVTPADPSISHDESSEAEIPQGEPLTHGCLIVIPADKLIRYLSISANWCVRSPWRPWLFGYGGWLNHRWEKPNGDELLKNAPFSFRSNEPIHQRCMQLNLQWKKLSNIIFLFFNSFMPGETGNLTEEPITRQTMVTSANILNHSCIIGKI